MKILNSKSKNFDKLLENLLLQRKKKIQSDSVSVTNIIKYVKKNGMCRSDIINKSLIL